MCLFFARLRPEEQRDRQHLGPWQPHWAVILSLEPPSSRLLCKDHKWFCCESHFGLAFLLLTAQNMLTDPRPLSSFSTSSSPVGLKLTHTPSSEHRLLWRSRSLGNHLCQFVTTVLNKDLPVTSYFFISGVRSVSGWGESRASAFVQTSISAQIDPLVLVPSGHLCVSLSQLGAPHRQELCSIHPGTCPGKLKTWARGGAP